MIADNSVKTIQGLDLSSYTTLKIGREAETAYFPSNINEILNIIDSLKKQNKKITVVGIGSNLLVSSQGVSGGVILTQNLKNYEISETGRVKVDCGIKSSKLAQIALEHNLSGLEFLIGIPGSLGGAVTMNSSAHGQGIEDTIESAEVLNIETGEIVTLDKSQLNLGYRYSFVESNKHLILNATFQLKEDDSKNISDKMEFHVNYRKQNHPPLASCPSAGSTFRNPAPGVFVGQLFEQLGAKNWVEGGARVSSIHCNFIVNTGNATSLDVSRLMYKMYNAVKDNYGYDLLAEIRFVGDATEEEEMIWKSFQVH
ncbi:MAG: UDP-N-acetylenolpyruvoylglucosamine reductase [Candidatus Melainabacteria bacterium RIFOXYA12_FULL_32_12]|nr:MAG: UDP-N-acetylenolpyruvoylglucosamine reductase [Candidatus Melainabacteria bacterium RIFOXYA12_FULL_32_12]